MKKDPLYPKHAPDAKRVPTPFARNFNNTDMGTGGNPNKFGGGVPMIPLTICRAPIGKVGKPEVK